LLESKRQEISTVEDVKLTDYNMDPNNIPTINRSSQKVEKIKFEGSPRDKMDATLRDFGQKVGKNYYDDDHEVNKPDPPNKMAM
jgi:hypothetical protein